MKKNQDTLTEQRAVIKARFRKTCPRCNSKRLDERLNGNRYCRRCGQAFTPSGVLVPSFDRRELKKKCQNML